MWTRILFLHYFSFPNCTETHDKLISTFYWINFTCDTKRSPNLHIFLFLKSYFSKVKCNGYLGVGGGILVILEDHIIFSSASKTTYIHIRKA